MVWLQPSAMGRRAGWGVTPTEVLARCCGHPMLSHRLIDHPSPAARWPIGFCNDCEGTDSYTHWPIEQAAEAADREAADSGTRHPSGNAEPRAGAPQGVLASAAADSWQRFREHLEAEADRIGYSHTEHYDGPGDPAQEVPCIPVTIAEQIAEKYWPSAAADPLEWRTTLSPAEFVQSLADAATLDVEALTAALRERGYVEGVASRYGTFNDSYWKASAERLAAAYAAAKEARR